MADVVQYRMEKMADELDDLERRGLFSRPEIAEIVKRRRQFEYRLKRPSPLKRDFLAYIDYEKQLDALRALRRRAALRAMRLSDPDTRWRKSLSDFASVRRILDIYRTATLRFKGDIELWFQYLEYCREKRNGRMKQVLAQVIRFHPKVPGLWIYAAAWEFDQNLNVTAARALMQRGLRACPKSEDLWVEYLRMELTYINKLKARKALLGEDNDTLSQTHENEDDKTWKEENEELFMTLDERKEVPNLSESEANQTKNKVDALREHASLIFQTIYGGAIGALPTSMSLRKRFLKILEDVDLAHSDGLKEEILVDMKKEFPGKEEYWDWLARHQILSYKNRSDVPGRVTLDLLNKAVQVYEEALNAVASAKMFSFYAKFWLDLLSESGSSEFSWISNDLALAANFKSNLMSVYEKAENRGYLTDDLAYQYVSLHLQIGNLEEARKLAERLCNIQPSVEANLWVLRASIEMKWATKESMSIGKENLNSVFDLLKTVLLKLSVAEAESLWLMAIKFFSNRRKYFDKLLEMFFVSMVRSGKGEDGFSVASAFVSSVLVKDGIDRAREIYKRFLSSPSVNVGVFRHCIELESNLAFTGINDGLVNARKLYESALSIYSEDASLWRDYYSLELKAGSPESANAVYWRARKTLKDRVGLIGPDKF